jgi:hypothetical protein
MKKYVLVFVLVSLTTARASSFTVARIGFSQAHIRNEKLDKDSQNTLTFGIGRRYYTSEPRHYYWGFDVIYSQVELTTQKVSYPDIGIGFENYVRMTHFNIKHQNFEIPILLGYAYSILKKSFINIESGILFSLAFKTDSDSKYDVIHLTDDERERYKFDFTNTEYYEPNPLSLNLLISANLNYQFMGVEFRYRHALNKTGEFEHLPHQYLDSFYVNMLFFF